MKTILLTGKNGQVGFELQRSLSVLGCIVAVDSAACNLADSAAIRALVRQVQPDIIVNPAAYTAVDKAESDADTAHAVNTVAPAVLAEEAARSGATLVHYSTDYVFDGSKQGAYSEADLPNPQSVYGKTKLAGEQAVQQSGCKHLVFRTSWVFGAHGGNFAKTMLRLAAERDELKIIADQFGAPTSAALLADVTALALYRLQQPDADRLVGLYHLVAAGETSWHGYASYVIEQARRRGYPLKAEHILPISTADYPLPARRPANSRLDTRHLQQSFGLVLPDWQIAVARLLDQIQLPR